ncbi:MAG: zinc ribbon domain-containing protein [Firmicutes bacterium]|nr:zinc ribbon domain-containing protein [Bacillota bacterium]
MPTYDYKCKNCGHTFELFQGITEKPIRRCPNCKRLKLHRLIGSGGGILFRGSGFYQTDHRSKAYKQAAEEHQTKKKIKGIGEE